MEMTDRAEAYRKQTGKSNPTPKQARRMKKKDVCPKCTARGTEICVTSNGTAAKQPHVGRY